MSITADEVAQATRDWLGAFSLGELERAFSIESTSFGYGFRNRQWRDIAAAGDAYGRAIGQWFEGLSHYSLQFEELHSRVAGDTGFAWGVYVEETEAPGHPRERARVRFSHALQKDESGWHVLMFHRDIQPFEEDGRYPRALTTA